MMRERVLAGLKRARAKGKKVGRPMISPAKECAIRADLTAGLGFRRIMARHGVGTSVIQRIKAEVAAQEATLAKLQATCLSEPANSAASTITPVPTST
jgi:DNA invertase Pin-like site-specific DNA recombinase